ncbi:hypothetical protein AB0O76_39820 [Streptomyces sp. NPDC086554]|uniref:hypothetical protein n=1 Tax=Streptomyces sp. NPDC086554 TaxID=3154864 RepID=UPI00341F6DD6
MGTLWSNGWRISRAVLSRPKGRGKSPFLAAVCLAEALGPVVPDDWDADGEPVGREWTCLGFKAKVRSMLDAYAIEPMEPFVNVPDGRVEFTTSAASSGEGFRPVFGVFDQTESWLPSKGCSRVRLASHYSALVKVVSRPDGDRCPVSAVQACSVDSGLSHCARWRRRPGVEVLPNRRSGGEGLPRLLR